MPKITHAKEAFIQRITALTASTGLIIPLVYSIVTEAKEEAGGAVIVNPEILSTIPDNLCIPVFSRLHSGASVSRTDRSLRNSFIEADDRHGKSPSGFLFVCNKSHLYNGVACSSAFMRAVSSIADFSDYKHPARLRNEQGAFKSNIEEANHA